VAYIAKKCIGCCSNKRHYGVSYSSCKINLGIYYRDYKLFREQYCPCVECLVKATCRDPKINLFTYGDAGKVQDKCKELRSQIVKFKSKHN